MAINLLKRLESSVNSFRLTLTRIRDFIKDSITAIDKFQESGASTIDVTDFSEDFDTEDNENDPFVYERVEVDADGQVVEQENLKQRRRREKSEIW